MLLEVGVGGSVENAFAAGPSSGKILKMTSMIHSRTLSV